MGVVWRTLAEAELVDDRDAWTSAVGLLTDAPAPVHLAPYAQLRLAGHVSAARDRQALRDLVAGAGEAARAIGARLLVRRLAALAQRAGVAPADGASVDRTPLAALTARETEVLRLVSRGLSNREIGGELFISTKTASVHVSNILAKLGAAGRAEAAAIAVRHGLLADADPVP
ncbi:LuxR C-terminal-related transcriptional regulator [Nocardioides sp. TF02-7]|nr:LuxR C-terminal-related transcriptional regulator [Nocardioides sp. TF02-7]